MLQSVLFWWDMAHLYLSVTVFSGFLTFFSANLLTLCSSTSKAIFFYQLFFFTSSLFFFIWKKKKIMGHMWPLSISASYMLDGGFPCERLCVLVRRQFVKLILCWEWFCFLDILLVQYFFSYSVSWEVTHLKFTSGFYKIK